MNELVSTKATAGKRNASTLHGRDVRLTRSLQAFAWTAAVCATSGTLLYCYPEALRRVQGPMIIIHDVTGDLAAVLLGVYLVFHLGYAWWMRRMYPISWWSGIAGLAAWIATIITGIYGQFAPLAQGSIFWWIHGIGSLLAVVIVCGHAAYGYRLRGRLAGVEH